MSSSRFMFMYCSGFLLESQQFSVCLLLFNCNIHSSVNFVLAMLIKKVRYPSRDLRKLISYTHLTTHNPWFIPHHLCCLQALLGWLMSSTLQSEQSLGCNGDDRDCQQECSFHLQYNANKERIPILVVWLENMLSFEIMNVRLFDRWRHIYLNPIAYFKTLESSYMMERGSFYMGALLSWQPK